VLRSVLLPADIVFDKLKDLDGQYFSQADRRVGIQLRSRQGKDYYQKMNATINKRILDCVTDNGILPNASSSSWDNEDKHPATSSTKVFIASLYRGLRDYLKSVYQDAHTVSGEGVDVIQVSSNEDQRLSKEEDIQAFLEIMLLSLSDQLLVTPSSTFGSIAQGYGALVPWFIEIREDEPDRILQACERAQSVDICHQHTETVYDCPYDPSMNTRPVFDNQPSLKKCLAIDHDSGIQLISTFQSDF
jgi:xyloglucan fucosyltransferase